MWRTFCDQIRDWLSHTSGLAKAGWAGRGLRGGACAQRRKLTLKELSNLPRTTQKQWSCSLTQPPDPEAHTFTPVRSRHPSEGTGAGSWCGQS